jgi:hypothetical protein
LSAFPDSEGVTCYQTYFGIWPKSNDYDEWILSAVLNSPVANAFVSTREGKIDITKEILEQVPIPILSLAQITSLRELIQKYQRLTKQEGFMTAINANAAEAERVLKLIDAAVLDGYHLPPRVEQELLEFFRGDERPTPFPFSAYLPEGEDVYFSLSERLSPRFKESTAGSLLKRMAIG